MKTLLTILGSMLLTANVLKAQCTGTFDFTNTGGSTSYALNGNKTLKISSGTFTGSITNSNAGSVICVAAGATFSPSSIADFKGTINVYGTANLPSFSLAANSVLNNYGTTNCATLNSYGNPTVNNYENAIMNFSGAFSIGAISQFENRGTVTINGDYSGYSSTTLLNNGIFRITGNLATGNTLNNYGYLYVGNTIQINGGTFRNSCRIFAKNGFTNGSSSTINNGFIWVGSGSAIFNAALTQSNNGEFRGGDFTCNTSISGSGKYYFTGTTTHNSGTFGSGGGGINFYDENVSGGGSKKFDNQWGTVHASVVRTAFTPSDTSGTLPTGCSSYYNPCNMPTASAGTDQVRCNGSTSFTMAANTFSGATGAWTVVSGSATITNSSSATSTITVAAGNTAVLRWTVTNSCGSATDDIQITHTALVVANAGADIARQNGSTSFAMAASSPAPGAGLWTLLSGNGTITNATSNTTNITVAVGDSAILEWKITNGTCVSRDTMAIRHAFPRGCIARTNNAWNNPATWHGACTGGGIPGINDTVVLSGQTITVSSTAACKSLTMTNTLGTCSLSIQANATFTVAEDIEMLATAQNTVVISMANNSNLRIGGTIKRNAAPNCYGRLTANSSATITFNGNGLQTIPSSRGNGTDYIQYRNVVFNNTSGLSPAFVSEGRVDVTNTITLTKGCIDMGRDTLMLTNNSFNAVSGGSDSSYVMGQFCRYIGQMGKTYRWSVGRKGTQGEYWFDLTNNIVLGTSYICVEFDSVPDDSREGISYEDSDIAASQLSSEGIWRVEPDAQPILGSYNAAVSIVHFNGLIDNNFGLLKRPTGSGVQNWGKGGGQLPGIGNILRSVVSGTTALTGLTSFSEFGMGGGSGGSLPVKLTMFEAKSLDSKYIRLRWVTETEINNMGFEVHRSTDGLDFNNIGWVNGNGTTAETKEYSYDDKTINANTRYYYRLKQVDFDAKSEHSPITSAEVKNTGGITEIGNFIPNPAKGTVSIKANVENDTDAEFIFYDMLGKVQKSGVVSMGKGAHIYYFDINEITSGNYVVAIVTPGSRLSRRLVVH